MALFGVPIAHEDGPRRAVHSALGIQRALRELSRELEAAGGPAIRMRVGLNSLTWQAAHVLARALEGETRRLSGASVHAVAGRLERALGAAQLAMDVVQGIVERLPDPALTRPLMAWPRVPELQEDLARLQRGWRVTEGGPCELTIPSATGPRSTVCRWQPESGAPHRV